MWHELATVLGGTVGELQARMSHAEFTRWLAYRKAHGPLGFDRRYDRPAAMLAQLYTQVHSKSPPQITDFMPWTEEPSASIDDIAKAFGAVRKR